MYTRNCSLTSIYLKICKYIWMHRYVCFCMQVWWNTLEAIYTHSYFSHQDRIALFNFMSYCPLCTLVVLTAGLLKSSNTSSSTFRFNGELLIVSYIDHHWEVCTGKSILAIELRKDRGLAQVMLRSKLCNHVEVDDHNWQRIVYNFTCGYYPEDGLYGQNVTSNLLSISFTAMNKTSCAAIFHKLFFHERYRNHVPLHFSVGEVYYLFVDRRNTLVDSVYHTDAKIQN